MLMIFYEMKKDYNIVLLYGLRITRDVYRSMDKSKNKKMTKMLIVSTSGPWDDE